MRRQFALINLAIGILTPEVAEVVIRALVVRDDSDAEPFLLATDMSCRINGPFWVDEYSLLG